MKLFYYNQRNYDKVAYNKPNGEKKTIASSGCGVVSACIVFNTLAQKELYTVKAMRDFAIKHGARTNGGTDENTLLKALCAKNKDFSYKTTSSITDLVNHLNKGGMAICNQGDKYNVFSSAGHYVVACYIVAGSIYVADPYMYSGKYDSKARKSRIVSKTEYGCIVSPSQMAKATADRNPSYYLISYKSEKKPEPMYKEGKTYTLQTDLKVRDGASVNSRQLKRSELSADAKKHAKIGLYAVLKKGTVVTCKGEKKLGKDVWVKIPSGWIAGYYNGNKYVK